MPKLRPKTKADIENILDQTYFTRQNYTVVLPEDGAILVAIKFKLNPEFSFQCAPNPKHNDYGNSSRYAIEAAPGNSLLGTERFGCDDFDDVFKQLKAWAARILEDYRLSTPVVREFDSLREQLETELNKHVSDQSAHFTKEEADALRARLSELEKRFDQLSENSSVASKAFQDIQSSLESLREDASTLPKGIWYRTALSKILRFAQSFANSTEGRQLVADTAKGLLLGGGDPGAKVP